jgi:hypothetical protein
MMHRASTHLALIGLTVLGIPAAFLSGETVSTTYKAPCPEK